MTDSFAEHYLENVVAEFRGLKRLADRAIAQLNDEEFFRTIDAESNSIALIMKQRRTMLVSHATMLRIVSQILLLFVLPSLMEGAVAGAASLVGCMSMEALYLYYVSRPFYRELPEKGGEQWKLRRPKSPFTMSPASSTRPRASELKQSKMWAWKWKTPFLLREGTLASSVCCWDLQDAGSPPSCA